MSIDLYQKCADIVNQVPKGRVTTYGAVAKALGDPIAKRAVGVMLNTYGPPIKMPCHRVVYSGGGLGGFAYGLPSKMKILAEEGVFEDDGKIADFENIFFDDFRSDRPLEKARRMQLELAMKVRLSGAEKPVRVLGLDASYDGTTAYAAGVLYDLGKGRVVESRTLKTKIDFPYVPTYLGFREVPIFRDLVGMADDGTVIMVDGNGTLHPFGFGIGCHIGVEFDRPAMGVAKTLLCGVPASEPVKAGDSSPITLDGKRIGHVLKTSQVGKPVFVSPGHRISMDGALDVARRASRLKIPEPLRLAHIAATEMRRADI